MLASQSQKRTCDKMVVARSGRRNLREGRCTSSPYWTSGPGMGVTVEGMKDQSALDARNPALAQTMRELTDTEEVGRRTVLKILEVCSGCGSVSAAAAKEARDNFGVFVDVFSVDGKPSTNATRVTDTLTYDWARDEQLRRFREERAEGVRYLYYAHASPPCGPYSSMANRYMGPLSQRDLRWGDSVVQRCLDLVHFFQPDFWTIESRGPPGLDSRPFMRALEPRRSTAPVEDLLCYGPSSATDPPVADLLCYGPFSATDLLLRTLLCYGPSSTTDPPVADLLCYGPLLCYRSPAADPVLLRTSRFLLLLLRGPSNASNPVYDCSGSDLKGSVDPE